MGSACEPIILPATVLGSSPISGVTPEPDHAVKGGKRAISDATDMAMFDRIEMKAIGRGSRNHPRRGACAPISGGAKSGGLG